MGEFKAALGKAKHDHVGDERYAMAKSYNLIREQLLEAFTGADLHRDLLLAELRRRSFLVLSPCARLDATMCSELQTPAREIADM
jgi:hypothetical protein